MIERVAFENADVGFLSLAQRIMNGAMGVAVATLFF
jgi:hypothetical protein